MHEKQLQLIRYIMKNSKPISCKQIASHLNVSTRTVMNYINDINNQYSESVITSTSNGYIVDKSKAANLLETVNSIPEGYQERSFYICKQLLMGNEKQVDIFELSDKMCISYSLLKNDLQKMNQSYAWLNVKFVVKHNKLSVSGSEKDKRKLMNHMLTQAQEINLLDMTTLKKYFSEEMVDTIQVILDNFYQKAGYYLNDFSKLNMMLHILTMVTRIINGNSILADNQKELIQDINDDHDVQLTKLLCEKIKESFQIEIGAADTLQAYFLVKSNSTLLEAKTKETLTKYVGDKLLLQIQEILTNTEQHFCIKLDSNDFFVRFVLHVSCMRTRSFNHINIVNPLKDSLRSSSPFLYDIAIYIVQQFRSSGILQGNISEDEISFIVIHIGAEIERQNETDNSIRCVLLVPEYLNMGQTIANKILKRFGEQIIISQIIHLENYMPDSSYDLIISVIDKNSISDEHCIYVSPFLTPADYTSISNAIEQIQLQKSLDYLRKNFDYYFSTDNFKIDTSKRISRDEAIDNLCNILIHNQYVTEDYKYNVLKRENAASTAYYNFAIPHSVSMEANINTIGVLIAPYGIQWNDHLVHVVFMMAISPDSLNDFQTLYRILAQILTETNAIKFIKNCESFSEFKKLLLNPEFQ